MKNTNNAGSSGEKIDVRVRSFFKTNYSFLIVFFAVFCSLIAVSFFDVATSETFFAFSLSEYQVDQISDRTVVAKKSYAPTALNLVEVQKDKEVIKKSFTPLSFGNAAFSLLLSSPKFS